MDTQEASSSNGHILIVDDTLPNLQLLSKMLTEEQYKVRGAPNGSLALSAAQADPPDLILLDINMPDLSGYEVCEHIKADERTADVPVIFISALSEVFDKVKAFEVGGIDYITKPFQIDEVLVRIENQLTIRRLRQELEARVEDLETYNRKYELELEQARRIQQGLLKPPQPPWTDLQVVCHSTPAYSVGGDFYNYHHLPDGINGEKRYAFTVGDISGKGLPASLLMATCLAELEAALQLNLPLADHLNYLDRKILPYAQATGQNCALCHLEIVIDSASGHTQAIMGNAAGVPPYIKRADGALEWVDIGGLTIGFGLGAEMGYDQATISLEKGDLIILTSDGVPEAFNEDGEIFGFPRIMDLLEKSTAISPEEILDELLDGVKSFTKEAEPHDDLTVMVIQV